MEYFIPKSLTYVSSKNVEYVYNWDLGDYIEFEQSHPFLEAVKRGDEYFKFITNKEDIDFLIDCRYLFPSMNEYLNFKDEILQEHDDKLSKSINLILLPAEQACNFSCVYCYEDHSVRNKMSDKESNALINFIRKECESRDVKYVNISYFGGEPLLNKRFILQFNKELTDLSNDLKFKFSSSMTTNGYLLDIKIAKAFQDLNLKSYQITLDGFEKEHDSLRPLTNGKGSYAQIVKNLLDIKASDLELLIDIRVNFNESHSDKGYQEKLINDLYDKFGRDSRFRVRFRPIGDYSQLNGKQTEASNSLCSKSIANDAQIKFETIAIEKGLELADISMLSEYGAYSCYAGKPNNFVIDSNLNVKMCTVALDVDMNNVGLLSSDGFLSLNANYSKWLEKHTKASCNTCFLNTQCASSACPLVNIQAKIAKCPPIITYKKEWSERLISFIERS